MAVAYIFGKTIETKKGAFKEGQPLPPEWSGPETRRQLREQFGDDVLVLQPDTHDMLAGVNKQLAAIQTDLAEIREALGLGDKEKKKKLNV